MGRKEELDDLIAAFDRVVHEDHPNPERDWLSGRARADGTGAESQSHSVLIPCLSIFGIARLAWMS